MFIYIYIYYFVVYYFVVYYIYYIIYDIYIYIYIGWWIILHILAHTYYSYIIIIYIYTSYVNNSLILYSYMYMLYPSPPFCQRSAEEDFVRRGWIHGRSGLQCHHWGDPVTRKKIHGKTMGKSLKTLGERGELQWFTNVYHMILPNSGILIHPNLSRSWANPSWILVPLW